MVGRNTDVEAALDLVRAADGESVEHLRSGARLFTSSKNRPAPPPPCVQNGATVFPASFSPSKNVASGAAYVPYHMGEPTNTMSYPSSGGTLFSGGCFPAARSAFAALRVSP